MVVNIQSKEKRPPAAVGSEGEDPRMGEEAGQIVFPSAPISEADWEHLRAAYDRSIDSFE